MSEYILTEIQEGLNKEELAQELIRLLKVVGINLKTLHRNLIGGEANWFQVHEQLNNYYWTIDHAEDTIVENLLGLGVKDKSIKGSEDILDCVPYTIGQAYEYTRKTFATLLTLISNLRENFELPSPILPVFDNFENFLHMEGNYKLNQSLKTPESEETAVVIVNEETN